MPAHRLILANGRSLESNIHSVSRSRHLTQDRPRHRTLHPFRLALLEFAQQFVVVEFQALVVERVQNFDRDGRSILTRKRSGSRRWSSFAARNGLAKFSVLCHQAGSLLQRFADCAGLQTAKANTELTKRFVQPLSTQPERRQTCLVLMPPSREQLLEGHTELDRHSRQQRMGAW